MYRHLDIGALLEFWILKSSLMIVPFSAPWSHFRRYSQLRV